MIHTWMARIIQVRINKSCVTQVSAAERPA
ncbi:hypothetical protein IFHNHDMJ_01197 [Synechococcus sp. CBW1107]|nr:hypothetical protein IFHNHDMJ_01197 [Synechococcus sp. CBW1107]